jgi:hypothetical protein
MAFGVRSTSTAQPGLHSLYSMGSRGTFNLAAGFTTGFAAATFTDRFITRFTGRFANCRFLNRFTERDLRPALRVVLVARIVPLSPASPAFAGRELRLVLVYLWFLVSGFRSLISDTRYQLSGTGSQPNYKKPYFLRCEIIRSVRLLLRVFLPSVGKAHGVTG